MFQSLNFRVSSPKSLLQSFYSRIWSKAGASPSLLATSIPANKKRSISSNSFSNIFEHKRAIFFSSFLFQKLHSTSFNFDFIQNFRIKTTQIHPTNSWRTTAATPESRNSPRPVTKFIDTALLWFFEGSPTVLRRLSHDSPTVVSGCSLQHVHVSDGTGTG